MREAIQTAAADREIGVLLITEKLAALCQDLIAPMKLTAQRPLVVEIPRPPQRRPGPRLHHPLHPGGHWSQGITTREEDPFHA